ncbi:hypothetical protein DPMN_144086 [Dreissena polymorpha]|uniref:Uncharacterized protein n=1 Tax=Dreissena polymorpha TaxID=45954 RepID=A0A9D4GEX8_DREPO|nr:hypothetical protein DPMN_144086 [Dreissena polymorpha]
MGHRVEMPCVYDHVTGETLIFIRWKKGDVILTIMVMSSTFPEWSNLAPDNLVGILLFKTLFTTADTTC